MGSQISSPTYVSKSQHGGKFPTFEPHNTIKIWLIIIESDLDYFMQNINGTYVESWAWLFALRIVAKLLCSCPCLFHAIFELHAMAEKTSNDFSH
jgi:hypothetical protein